jgi:ubiquinone/menaquinone biosynthesis C-methylase UbiE
MMANAAAERPLSGNVKAYKGMGMDGFTARWYAKNTANLMEDYRADARRVAALLGPKSKVLEVAPGPGYFAVELAKLGDFAIVGLDISKTCVEIARENAAKSGVRAEFRQGNAAEMPFGDEEFDFLFCRAAFKNFSEPIRALQEMRRVLKPGGRALIVDLRRDATPGAIDEAVSKMNLGWFDRILTRLTFRHMLVKRAYTSSAFRQMVTAAEFQTIRVEEGLIGLDVWLKK